MTETARQLTALNLAALDAPTDALDRLEFSGDGNLLSAFAVTDMAAAAVAAAALSIAELIGQRAGTAPRVVVDRRLASKWFQSSIRPLGWSLPTPWDPIAGDYPTRDGWIRLHTNAPHHRAAAESVLGAQATKEAMALAVAGWQSVDLETAVVEAGGCAAEMRSRDDWLHHPQGQAVVSDPLVQIVSTEHGPAPRWHVPATRPLEGVRVLDLTRVLAGPVASRFLAGYGADVLRIDPPSWDEPGVVPEVALGKRCARLDLRRPDDRTVFTQLLSEADVVLHGYRPGALEGLGFGPGIRRHLASSLVDVSLNAYGWSGPWATRRGFDSLVQMSTGIADAGMRWHHADKPGPLPVQALDHATGYLMAAAAIRGIVRRITTGIGSESRLSLARTAKLLVDHAGVLQTSPLAPETVADIEPLLEKTDWGNAQRLVPPMVVEGAKVSWDYPARRLGTYSAAWAMQQCVGTYR